MPEAVWLFLVLGAATIISAGSEGLGSHMFIKAPFPDSDRRRAGFAERTNFTKLARSQSILRIASHEQVGTVSK
jgi:hypothetical protein